MKAGRKLTPTGTRRNKSRQPVTAYEKTLGVIEDVVGQIACQVGIVETLANAAAMVAARTGDDRTCRRRLCDLVVQIENATVAALATVRDLEDRIEGAGRS